MPVAVATPPVIVHEVGSKTAGLSLVEDSGTEVCTGIVMLGVSAEVLATGLGGGEGLADIGGGADCDGDVAADGGAVDTAGDDALRLPACFPTKNAAMHSPISTINPATARFRLVEASIEPT